MGCSLKHFKVSIITELKTFPWPLLHRELVFFPQIRSAGTFTREALESNANFDGRNSAARYS